MTVDDGGVATEDGACVLVVAPLGRIVAAGGATNEVLEADGRHLAFLSLRDLVHPDDRGALVDAMAVAVHHAAPADVALRVRAGRQWTPVQLSIGAPSRDDAGRIDRWGIRLWPVREATGGARRRGRRADEISPIERAIVRGELDLDVQPIVGLTTHEVVCLEGLVRWQRPGGARLRPHAFLAQAERLGVMDQVMRRVLLLGCEALVGQVAHVPALSVNVSASQLEHPAFLADLDWVLDRTGADPQRLTLELTGLGPTARLDDVARILGRAVAEVGVRVALDDVGAESSSVAALTCLPIEVVKIDRTFTGLAARPEARRPREALGGLVDLAHRLGCQVVAEGVETEAQLEVARAAGVDHVQGFLLGRPVPLDALPGAPAPGAHGPMATAVAPPPR